jgi:cold shock CspA family protein
VTGTIKSLDLTAASGTIMAEDGLLVGFMLSAVLAYDLPVLAVGQEVGFDLQNGKSPKALNIFVRRSSGAAPPRDKNPDTTRLRYLGFQHRGNTRVYLFEWLLEGARRRTFAVEAELAIFTKHKVGMQEGPAICLHTLLEGLGKQSSATGSLPQCSLSDREILAYLASRPAPRVKHGFKRTHHEPS